MWENKGKKCYDGRRRKSKASEERGTGVREVKALKRFKGERKKQEEQKDDEEMVKAKTEER